MKPRYVVIALSCLGFLQTGSIQATPIGMIGGDDSTGSSQAYAAFVNSDGTFTPFSGGGLPTSGRIATVAVNKSGGLIGGQNIANGSPYAATVASDGKLTQLSGEGFPSQGYIVSVAINSSGAGLVGGQDVTGSHPPYVGRLAPNGTLTQLSSGGFPPSSGNIFSVAINDSGTGLIGGDDLTGAQPAYAAIVAPDGTVTPLSGGGLPTTAGFINSVAINNSGIGLIGGGAQGGEPGYVALVMPDGTLIPASGSPLPAPGDINSVAINNSGAGIVGGIDSSVFLPVAYAALVAPDGTLTPLAVETPSSAFGTVEHVAINNSGAGILEWRDATGGLPPYVALVAPDGTLTIVGGSRLSSASGALTESEKRFPSAAGVITSVAINDAGLGLIGGSDGLGAPAYLALVAPNGTLTELSGNGFPSTIGSINSVAFGSINSSDILAAATPQFISSFWGPINTQLAASYALESHLTMKAKMYNPCEMEAPNTIWVAPFGNYVHQKAQGVNPSSNNSIGGVLVGYDYSYYNLLFGGAVGYAYDYLSYGSGFGHGSVQEEMISLYGAYNQKQLSVNVALWGGLYQFYNKRFTLSLPSSSANSHGWILSPHLEVGVPFEMKIDSSYRLEPFAMFDWVNSWQRHFTEKGSSGLNLRVDDHYCSVLRSEAGVRFFEEYCAKRGKFLFEQKLSYVNQAPFHFDPITTAFVASASTFPIAIGSSRVQNLAGVELSGTFFPADEKYPYIILDFQGEFGSSYQSYFGCLEIGKSF